jgi:hypothetical protein
MAASFDKLVPMENTLVVNWKANLNEILSESFQTGSYPIFQEAVRKRMGKMTYDYRSKQPREKEMKRIVVHLLMAFVMASSIACRKAPVMSIRDSPISPAAPSFSKVEKAIKNAALSLNWKARKVEPGLMEATLFLRSHKAVVTIPYTKTTYSILYKNSENLKYNGTTIHSNYNDWVQNLDRAIQRELL